jgi:hypothetical protein
LNMSITGRPSSHRPKGHATHFFFPDRPWLNWLHVITEKKLPAKLQTVCLGRLIRAFIKMGKRINVIIKERYQPNCFNTWWREDEAIEKRFFFFIIGLFFYFS